MRAWGESRNEVNNTPQESASEIETAIAVAKAREAAHVWYAKAEKKVTLVMELPPEAKPPAPRVSLSPDADVESLIPSVVIPSSPEPARQSRSPSNQACFDRASCKSRSPRSSRQRSPESASPISARSRGERKDNDMNVHERLERLVAWKNPNTKKKIAQCMEGVLILLLLLLPLFLHHIEHNQHGGRHRIFLLLLLLPLHEIWHRWAALILETGFLLLLLLPSDRRAQSVAAVAESVAAVAESVAAVAQLGSRARRVPGVVAVPVLFAGAATLLAMRQSTAMPMRFRATTSSAYKTTWFGGRPSVAQQLTAQCSMIVMMVTP
jgi:hypothetical protein